MALHALERRFLSQAIVRRLFPEPGLVVVAVSGGPDSVALVHALHALRAQLGIELLIGHLDHGLRGAESIADAAAVGVLAGRLGLPAEIGVQRVTVIPGENLEERAREARYAFLTAVAGRHAATYLAIGHTANDQAETLLMRLVRGAGPRGLTAMTPLASRLGVAVVRPLLDLPRDLVRKYLADLQLSYHLDRTNEDLDRQRTKVRHVLLPLLQAEFNPNVVHALSRTATLMDEVERYLAERAREALPGVVATPPALEPAPGAMPAKTELPASLSLDLSRLAAQPTVVRRYLLRAAVERLRGDLRSVSFAHVEALFQLAEGGRGGRRLHFPGGIVVLREGRTLTFWSQDPGMASSIPRTPIRHPDRLAEEAQEVLWPELGQGIRIRVVKTSEAAADSWVRTPLPGGAESRGGENERRAVFDRAQLDFPLHVRSRRDGDRIQLAGRASIRKVKDVLIAAQVPRRLRPGVPLLVDGAEAQERVLWVAGVARSAHAAAKAGARELVEVELFSWKRAPADHA